MTGGGSPWPASELERLGRCPLCGSDHAGVLYEGLTDGVFFSAPGTWTLCRCDHCGCAYLDPRPTEASIGTAYASYYTHELAEIPSWLSVPNSRFPRTRWRLRAGYINARYGYRLAPASRLGRLVLPLLPRARENADRWVRHAPRPSGRAKLLDVGCGEGYFLREMLAAGWDVVGIEPDPQAASTARRVGAPVIEARLVDAELPGESFDLVTLNHVLEHMHDPLTELTACRLALRPSGLLWIATPNLSSAGHARFGRSWLGLDPPRHLVLFTPSALVNALGTAGFEIVREPLFRVAPHYFRSSFAIARGADPMHDSRRLPRILALRARLADVRATLQHAVAEEIVVLARKKRSGSLPP